MKQENKYTMSASNDALKEWLSISESQICSTEVLSEQLPKVNNLLEKSMNDISTHFGIISNILHKISEQTKDIKNLLENKSEINSDQLDIIEKEISNSLKEISSIVVGMQFQDRVSQNIIITTSIMKSISAYLEDRIGILLPHINKEERKKLLDKEFAVELLEKFRLGELQHSFVDHLLSHGYIENPSEIGFTSEKTQQNDDVDLF